MKNSEKKALGRSILNTSLSFAKGLIGGANPIIGMAVGAVEGTVKGLQKEKDKNLATQTGGEGKIDFAHISGVVVFLVLVGAFVAGLITLEDVGNLLKLFLKTQ